MTGSFCSRNGIRSGPCGTLSCFAVVCSCPSRRWRKGGYRGPAERVYCLVSLSGVCASWR